MLHFTDVFRGRIRLTGERENLETNHHEMIGQIRRSMQSLFNYYDGIRFVEKYLNFLGLLKPSD
jgi:hypothetical protein